MPEPRFDAVLVEFSRAVRDAGLRVGTGDVVTFCSSVVVLDPTDLLDIYWAGRTSLVTQREQIPVYDEVFMRYFLDGDDHPGQSRPFSVNARAEARSVLDVPETESGPERREEREARLGLVASAATTAKTKSFAACTPEELAALRRIMRTMRLTPPRRVTRRTRASRSGRSLDLRRTVQETMRVHGEPTRLHWRRRRKRLRPLTMILDVSGSMADYSRNLVQFAHTSTRAADRVEVFCFGTRLTRITRALDQRRLDAALDRAAAAVNDWEGGTRIGQCLDAFVRTWARAGRCRGGIVVICSDGLDRGDPALLEVSMRRLAGLCHKIVWVNPHRGDRSDHVPSSLGMLVAMPYVDALLSGHDLASLQELAEALPGLR